MTSETKLPFYAAIVLDVIMIAGGTCILGIVATIAFGTPEQVDWALSRLTPWAILGASFAVAVRVCSVLGVLR